MAQVITTPEKGQENQEKIENKIEETAVPKSHDDLIGKPGDNLEPEDETPKEETSETTPEEVEEIEEEDDPEENVVAELSAQLREVTAELQSLKAQAEERDAALREQGLLDEVDQDAVLAAQKAEEAQQIKLETLYEVMAVNPAFEGLDEILSVENQDAIIRDFGKAYAEEYGVSQVEAEQKVYQGIMEQPNPIKWYYENIKATYYEEESKEETPPKTPPGNSETPKPKDDAPPSLGNAGGSAEVSGSSSWTMKRLDNMSDLQMANVPQEVREKYLNGTLPSE